MRGKVAKRLRRAIYGENFSPREREYEWQTRKGVRRSIRYTAHQLVNRGRRAAYQAMKNAVRNGR